MAKKKGKSKMSLSVKKNSKQKKGQQKQSQSLSVNINLGKGKARQSKPQNPKLPAPFPPNYPPFFNQNQPNNWFNPPPPISQKQYSVLPEAETASILNLLSNVPVPLTVEGNPLKEKAKEPNLATVTNQPAPEFVASPEENPFVAPTEENIPEFVTSLDEPIIEPTEEQPPPLSEPEQPLFIPEQKQKSLTSFFPSKEGTIEPPKEEKKKRGAPRGQRKPKYEASVPEGQSQFAIPIKQTFAEAIPAEAFTFSEPLAQQPFAVLQQKPIPEKATETLERRRAEAIPSEEASLRFVN
jgi:hypothetical protein